MDTDFIVRPLGAPAAADKVKFSDLPARCAGADEGCPPVIPNTMVMIWRTSHRAGAFGADWPSHMIAIQHDITSLFAPCAR